MHLRAKPPIFVPSDYHAEIESLSKAALMDLVWDFAATATGEESPGAIMETIRDRAKIVLFHRSQS